MFGSYSARNWFWIVGTDEERAWSSAAGAYVLIADAPEGMRTYIAGEIMLYDVLAKAGRAAKAPQGPFSLGEIADALTQLDADAMAGVPLEAEALRAVAQSLDFRLPPIA